MGAQKKMVLGPACYEFRTGPLEYVDRTCWMVHERGKPRGTDRCCSPRHFKGRVKASST